MIGQVQCPSNFIANEGFKEGRNSRASRTKLLLLHAKKNGDASIWHQFGRCEWHPQRRATGDDVDWRGRATDDSCASGASRKEPCPLALWFQESCADQAWHLITIPNIIRSKTLQIRCDISLILRCCILHHDC